MASFGVRESFLLCTANSWLFRMFAWEIKGCLVVFLLYNNYHVQHDQTKTKMCSKWIPPSLGKQCNHDHRCQFFHTPVLFKTSKCLYPKLIHIFQIRVMEKMPYVAIQTSALDCPRPSHWVLGFSKRRSALWAGDQRSHPDSAHIAHSLDLSKNHPTGTNTPWGIRASEGHTSAGERERGRTQLYKPEPCLSLDRAGDSAVECGELKSMRLQAWFLLRAFRRIKWHTAGRSPLIPAFRQLMSFLPLYWGTVKVLKSWVTQSSAGHLFLLHILRVTLFWRVLLVTNEIEGQCGWLYPDHCF